MLIYSGNKKKFCTDVTTNNIAINAPTIINAADVTSTEITLTSGEKNKAIAKHAAITTDVKPVLPPTAMPADDSTLVAGVDVPKIAPITPAAESASNPLPMFGILLSFIIPAWLAKPINAPAVSKKATIKNVKMTVNVCALKMSSKCVNTTPNVGSKLGMLPTTEEGISINPKIIPTIVVITIA